jgi:hypothetical protein
MTCQADPRGRRPVSPSRARRSTDRRSGAGRQ